MKPQLRIKIGDLIFTADWEETDAPLTCAAFRKLLPLTGSIIQARWCGESACVPLDHLPLNIELENHTSHPSKGELILYPGGISTKEIVIPYDSSAIFATRAGPLSANHFATITGGLDNLEEMGRRVVWEGAQDIEFTSIEE